MSQPKELNPDVERLPKLKLHLAALEAFIDSPAHEGYLEGCKTEIAQVEYEIASFEPCNQDQFLELAKLYGMRRALLPLPNRFQDARDILKSRIDEVEQHIKSSGNQ
jgi:hypothetical protein